MKKSALVLVLLLLTCVSWAQRPRPHAPAPPPVKAVAPLQAKPDSLSADSLKMPPPVTQASDSLKLMQATNNPPAANESAPEVIITGHETKGIVDSDVVRAAIDHYYQTRIEGFQQSGLPRFIITGRERRFLLGIGGFVNFKMSYDFRGAIDNRDFITYDIPVPATEASKQRFGMDAASSRIFFKAIANSNTLGQVESYIEMDFRSVNTLMRMRYAYISFKGLLFGRSVTTFCDLSASPTTVDSEGPNAYTFNFNEMVRYTHNFRNKHWSAAVSLEAPAASLTTTDELQTVPQRIPDIPMYAQYTWDKLNHIRLSTIMRELRYYDSVEEKAKGRFGWGMQLSGSAKMVDNLTLYSQLVYGKGIARYIQDIAGVGMDLLPDPNYTDRMVTLPMGGWFAALQYNYSSTAFFCAGYSHVEVFRPSYYPKDDTYHRAQYFFTNLFVNVGASCTLGLEYIHGVRRNMNDQSATANRIQAMIQYNF